MDPGHLYRLGCQSVTKSHGTMDEMFMCRLGARSATLTPIVLGDLFQPTLVSGDTSHQSVRKVCSLRQNSTSRSTCCSHPQQNCFQITYLVNNR
jgi:hypothetical protein